MRMTSTLMIMAFAIASLPLSSCDKGTERWTTTENTNVPLDWDKVNEAYKAADGPADFEKRVNEIYEGDEVISVSVQDLEGNTQLFTGFFDKDKSGTVQEGEKVFTIRRTLTGEGSGQYQTQGYGAHYGYYHSPVMGIFTGMMMGSMLSNAFRPNYVPMYREPYTTPASRVSDLHSSRSSYRAANPARFKSRMSGSGSNRSYGAKPSRSFGGGFRSGGGRFGIRRREGVSRTQQRLTA